MGFQFHREFHLNGISIIEKYIIYFHTYEQQLFCKKNEININIQSGFGFIANQTNINKSNKLQTTYIIRNIIHLKNIEITVVVVSTTE